MSSYSQHFMKMAIQQARLAFELDEVPVGAVVISKGCIIGFGHNQVIAQKSVAAHAEIIAINNASRAINNYRLVDCDLYVTLEPCHMCAKAIVDSRITNLYFSALEPKTGAIISVDNFLDSKHLNHQVNYSYGHMKNKSAGLLQSFFQSKRS
jgi:tRNA(adenine34) deaminase